MPMRKLFFLINIFPLLTFGQKLNTAFTNIKNFSDSAYFYKIFVHTDKEKYYVGENIWFKAYLFDFSQKKSTQKQLLFAQLINFESKTIIHKNYYIQNNTSDGKIILPDTLPEGAYQLRFYCNPQKNFSPEFYFTKEIYIYSDKKSYSSEFYKKAKKLKKTRKQLKLQYSIEGKQIVYNLPCKIFYKISDNREKTLNANIYISDNKKNIISKKDNISSGFLKFIPKQGEKYYVIAEKNKYKKYKAPIANIQTYGITANYTETENKFDLKFLSNKITSKDTVSSTYMLIGFCNNKIIYLNHFKLDSTKKISIEKNKLPEGIIFFYLINKYSNIENTLSFFNSKHLESPITLTYQYQKDTLILTLFSQTSTSKDLSISITNDTQYFYNITEYINFFSNTPEFRNYQEKHIISKRVLCELYARQCFNLSKITKNSKINFPHKPVSALSIQGKVSFVMDKIPAKSAKIKLRILNSFNDEYNTVSDKNGIFKFNQLVYPDSIEFMLEGVSRYNKKYIIFFMNETDSEKIYFNPFVFMDYYDIKYKYIKSTPQPKEPHTPGTLHSHADQIIYSDEIEQSDQMNMLEFLQGRVPGYQKVGNSAIIRGYSSITQSNEPLFLIDNIQVDANAVANLDPHNIERIEIIRNAANSAIYGQRGSNGVIAFYTKQGHLINWGKLHGKMAGISYSEKFFITDSAYYQHKTFYWNPAIKLSDKIILKIPLSKKDKYFVYINGIEKNNQPVAFSQEIFIK